MQWRWLIPRLVGVALIVLGAALWARAQSPQPITDPRPIAAPTPADLSLLTAQSVAPAPVDPPPPAPASAPAAPAATNAPAGIHVVIPHDEHLHFTRVVHWHFPSRPAKAAPAVAAPPPAVYASPQAPTKFRFFNR